MINKESTRDVVDKLNNYVLMQKNIEYIEKKIKMIESELTKIRVSNFEENIRGVPNYRIEKLLDEKTRLFNKLNDLKLEKKFIVEAVNTLDNVEKNIINAIYFNINVSIKNMYSERHLRRIRDNALHKLVSLLF